MVTVACFCQFLVVKLISCFGVEPIGSAATRRALILVGIDVAARLMGNVMFRLFFFHFVQYLVEGNLYTTIGNGSLGTHIDEERS